MNEENPGPTDIKGDNSREITICAGGIHCDLTHCSRLIIHYIKDTQINLI